MERGRESCRGRGEITWVAGSLEKKKEAEKWVDRDNRMEKIEKAEEEDESTVANGVDRTKSTADKKSTN